MSALDGYDIAVVVAQAFERIANVPLDGVGHCLPRRQAVSWRPTC